MRHRFEKEEPGLPGLPDWEGPAKKSESNAHNETMTSKSFMLS